MSQLNFSLTPVSKKLSGKAKTVYRAVVKANSIIGEDELVKAIDARTHFGEPMSDSRCKAEARWVKFVRLPIVRRRPAMV